MTQEEFNNYFIKVKEGHRESAGPRSWWNEVGKEWPLDPKRHGYVDRDTLRGAVTFSLGTQKSLGDITGRRGGGLAQRHQLILCPSPTSTYSLLFRT